MALFLRAFVLEDMRVISDSMTPNLLEGDLIFLNKLSLGLRIPMSGFVLARFSNPKRGDILAFDVPGEGPTTYVKRVVAVGGEKIEIVKGQLVISGHPYSYRPTSSSDVWVESQTTDAPGHLVRWENREQQNFGPVEVPPGYFFAMGDNRSHSLDSRQWGPVPTSAAEGRAVWIWFSLTTEGAVRWDRVGKRIGLDPKE